MDWYRGKCWITTILPKSGTDRTWSYRTAIRKRILKKDILGKKQYNIVDDLIDEPSPIGNEQTDTYETKQRFSHKYSS
jgi:hypothetical protein